MKYIIDIIILVCWGFITFSAFKSIFSVFRSEKWFRLAANQNYPDALVELGLCYQKGLCIVQNNSKAFLLWTRAAEQKQPEALFNVGLCYANGIGIHKNPAKALFWFKLYSKYNFKADKRAKAERSIMEISKLLSAEQIFAVNQEVQEWLLSNATKKGEGSFFDYILFAAPSNQE